MPRLLITSLALIFFSPVIFGADKTKGLDVRLISETTAIAPGQSFTVGLHIKHHVGYHTYWKSPGIVGLPTSLDWKLPPGFKASKISWPYPEQTTMAGHPCYGYERDVTLLVTITPPKVIQTKKINLSTTASWMCCADNCFPDSKNLSLSLSVAPQITRDTTATKLIRQARNEVPHASKAWMGFVLTGPNEKTIRLKISPPSGTSLKSVFLFSQDGQIASDKKQTITAQPDGSWLLTAQRSEFSPKNPIQLSSVLKVGERYIVIYPKYPK